MIKSLYSGASGMYAQQLNIDLISNNLANVNTTGFKKGSMEFQDLIYQTIRAAGLKTGNESETPTELQIGSGVKPVSSNRNFEQGNLLNSGNPLDIAIAGEGFFKVQQDNGKEVYSRDGHLKLSAEGVLVTNDGYIVQPQINIPEDTEAVMISENGVVSVIMSGESIPQEVGQIELARFVNPGGLKAAGQNLYETTAASGEPVSGTPLSTGFGKLNQGYVENSNVNLVQEMVSMITAQRAYELNSKSIKTADDMLTTANQLKR